MGVNEILTTLMLNYIAILLVRYLIVQGPWTTPEGRIESSLIPSAGRLPLIGNTDIPYSIFIALGAAVMLYLLLGKTKIGYDIKAHGHNPRASRYAGVSSVKVALIVMILAGCWRDLQGFIRHLELEEDSRMIYHRVGDSMVSRLG